MPHLTRRKFLHTTLATATAASYLKTARSLGLVPPITACTLTPEQEIGPFYVAGEMTRPNIAEGKPGVPLDLHIAILDARTCQPIPNAAIDLWHCDALGLYSSFTKTNFGPPPGRLNGGGPGAGGRPPNGAPDQQNGPPPGPPPNGGGNFRGGAGPPAMQPSDKLTFLRGIQTTGADGTVRFSTIFPGFYQGRTNHVHFKVRIGDTFGSVQSSQQGIGRIDNADGHVSHVGQIFFPEDVAVELMSRAPYSDHKIHRTTQSEDGIFRGQSGSVMLAQIKSAHGDNFHDGLSASIAAMVDPTTTPAPVGIGGPGGPGGRGGPGPGGPPPGE
jgi:protocatechuate 3,4-dioxygenase beta subunit